MQTVPSLVGTGTVVAAAATGLVFGQPTESNPPSPSRPSSPFKRKLFSEFGFDNSRSTSTAPSLSRPETSSALPPPLSEGYSHFNLEQVHPLPLTSNPTALSHQPPTPGIQPTPTKSNSQRQPHIRPSDVATANSTESSRDSFSSSQNSWMRRLSLRPPSLHDSPRSSVGPESPFSVLQGPGEPVLSPTTSVASSTMPNKLIKRVGTNSESIFARRNSRGQAPTLRRPATSHQRSVTAQQFPLTPTLNLQPGSASLEPSSRPRASTAGQPNTPWRVHEPASWTSFFHVRVKTLRRGHVITTSTESNPVDYPVPGARRIQLRRGSLPRPFLINPQRISGETFVVVAAESDLEQSTCTEKSLTPPPEPSPKLSNSSEQSRDVPTNKGRLSLSTHFNATSGWIARAGSLRRVKRSSVEQSDNRRYVSDPTSPTSNTSQSNGTTPVMDEMFTPPKSGHRNMQKLDVSGVYGRECTSPTQISSFNMDLSRLGPSPPSSAGGFQASSPTQLSPTAAPFGAPIPSHSRAVSKEGASTLAGSEASVPGLASGDDDTDYNGDVLFDSFRTADTNRLETPIDTMFEDFTHGSMGNTKTKRLSIQEILGNSWDGDTRILEEDEGTTTPMRVLREPRIQGGMHHTNDRSTEMARYQLSMGDRNIARLSLDTTDDDYDWARDEDEVLSNPLSPPTSSVNSRRGPSPPLRLRPALASISGNSPSDFYTVSAGGFDRPRSTVFDWSEPSHDKSDEALSRPRTVHGKQELDLRGGRPANRIGFLSAHVRSQSVPVVPDLLLDSTKPTSTKFGTWAVGAKNASEDWDDDFDFEEGSISGSGLKNTTQSFSMPVPESIKATQPTVKAHSGQIRELSLLVNNLKRLCRQGRELDLLGGQATPLWKEAENIIELASPDEEEAEESDTDRSLSDFDPSMIDDRFLDDGFDASTLDKSDSSSDIREPDIPKNAVVRERQIVRRRSVFSPDDDIFGTNMSDKSSTRPHTPRTPDRVREFHTPEGTVVSSVIAAMEHQRSQPNRPLESPLRPSKAKLFFDTNSLQELVKRASTVFHALSDIVRREELLTMSPQATPRHDHHRRGGSPAFTRVFTDPDAGSPRHLVKSQNSHSPLPRKSLDSKNMAQRMQMMTVS